MMIIQMTKKSVMDGEYENIDQRAQFKWMLNHNKQKKREML